MTKTFRLIIDSPEKRKKFITMVKKFFGKELKQNTIRIATQECDIVEFAFKDNGFISIPNKFFNNNNNNNNES